MSMAKIVTFILALDVSRRYGQAAVRPPSQPLSYLSPSCSGEACAINNCVGMGCDTIIPARSLGPDPSPPGQTQIAPLSLSPAPPPSQPLGQVQNAPVPLRPAPPPSQPLGQVQNAPLLLRPAPPPSQRTGQVQSAPLLLRPALPPLPPLYQVRNAPLPLQKVPPAPLQLGLARSAPLQFAPAPSAPLPLNSVWPVYSSPIPGVPTLPCFGTRCPPASPRLRMLPPPSAFAYGSRFFVPAFYPPCVGVDCLRTPYGRALSAPQSSPPRASNLLPPLPSQYLCTGAKCPRFLLPVPSPSVPMRPALVRRPPSLMPSCAPPSCPRLISPPAPPRTPEMRPARPRCLAAECPPLSPKIRASCIGIGCFRTPSPVEASTPIPLVDSLVLRSVQLLCTGVACPQWRMPCLVPPCYSYPFGYPFYKTRTPKTRKAGAH